MNMTPEEVRWVRSQRITEVEEEQCRDQRSADSGRCAYASPDGKDACGVECRLRPTKEEP